MARKRTRSAAFLQSLRNIGMLRIGIFATLGIVGSWLAFGLAVSGVARIKAPDAALMVMPGDSTALAAKADQLLFANPLKPSPEVARLATKALQQQAINPKALRILGYVEDASGNSGKAEQFIRMAAKLSRREPGAQLWLIEAFARKGDVAQTLVHYDIALRTRPETQSILYPRLVNAIEDRAIRAALKPYIRAKGGWGGGFLSFAVNNSKNLPVVVDLITETGSLSDPDEARATEVALLGRLVREQYFGEARKLYLQMPDAQPDRLTSPAFAAEDRQALFGPMGWQLIDDPDAGGGFSGDGKRPSLSVFANSATTRPVATKLLYLGAGQHIFQVQLKDIDRGTGSFLRWELRCPNKEGGTVLWTVDSITPRLKASFSVPANCPVQYLNLIASGGNGQTGMEATISSALISPAG